MVYYLLLLLVFQNACIFFYFIFVWKEKAMVYYYYYVNRYWLFLYPVLSLPGIGAADAENVPSPEQNSCGLRA